MESPVPGPYTVTITKSEPQVDVVANQTYCAGNTVPSVVFEQYQEQSSAGGTITYSDSQAGYFGTGNVPSFTPTNNSGAPITSTFNVVATFTNNG
jgi:hypothetical protein